MSSSWTRPVAARERFGRVAGNRVPIWRWRDLLYGVADAVSAIIAVAGTLLGSALTFLFQQRSSERLEAYRFRQRLWEQRMSAYSAFTTALTELRRGQADWYNRRLEDPDGAAEMAARVESYRLRGVALAALSQVRLVAGAPRLEAAASEAFDLTRLIRHARDSDEFEARSSAARAALDSFIGLAAADVQAVAAVVPADGGGPKVAPLPSAEPGA